MWHGVDVWRLRVRGVGEIGGFSDMFRFVAFRSVAYIFNLLCYELTYWALCLNHQMDTTPRRMHGS